MFATMTTHRQNLQAQAVGHEERIRRILEEKERENGFLAKQARDAERILREARAAHEQELRDFQNALEAERRKVSAERYHSNELQNNLERLRRERERWHSNSDNSREDLEAARAEVARLSQQHRQLREQMQAREDQVQQGNHGFKRELDAVTIERDGLMVERGHLMATLEEYRQTIDELKRANVAFEQENGRLNTEVDRLNEELEYALAVQASQESDAAWGQAPQSSSYGGGGEWPSAKAGEETTHSPWQGVGGGSFSGGNFSLQGVGGGGGFEDSGSTFPGIERRNTSSSHGSKNGRRKNRGDWV